MGLDLSTTHGWLVSELTANRGIDESMSSLIDCCERALPHPDWDDLRGLPYGDLASLAIWLEKSFRLDPPGAPLRGLWFGLSNPIRDSAPTADLHMYGSKDFDSDSVDCDWACDAEWRPDHDFAESVILAAIYQIAYRPGGLENDAEYPLCLGYAAFAIKTLLNTVNPILILESVGPVGVAVGFDSGDSLLLGQFTSAGLAPL